MLGEEKAAERIKKSKYDFLVEGSRSKQGQETSKIRGSEGVRGEA